MQKVDFYYETATLIDDIRVRRIAFDENVAPSRVNARQWAWIMGQINFFNDDFLSKSRCYLSLELPTDLI